MNDLYYLNFDQKFTLFTDICQLEKPSFSPGELQKILNIRATDLYTYNIDPKISIKAGISNAFIEAANVTTASFDKGENMFYYFNRIKDF